MPKNIVVCCDGTGNEFSQNNTNVVRLFEVIKKHPDEQVAYYDPGVGTFGMEMIGLITGYGITQNIKDAYEYLMNRYEKDDFIYLFGFSRGAFTVRALAGMIEKCGLLEKGSGNMIDYAVQMYKGEDNDALAADFKKTFSRECPVYFIGVWDTVKAVIPFSKIARFQGHRLHDKVKFGIHALSIDEKRKQYAPELWDETKKAKDQMIEQVWFAGVHSDIGGSYAEPGLADITLKWMLEHARTAGLLLNPDAFDNIHPNHFDLLHDSRTGNGGIWKLFPPKSRKIPEGSKIHSSVFERLQHPELIEKGKKEYKPDNLPASRVIV